MRLAVVSYKNCWRSAESASGYATDGGFPMQMQAISELFSATTLVIPCDEKPIAGGITALEGENLTVCPLPVPKGVGWRRKFSMISWLIKNGRIIFREVRQADAVHAPIPGDIGTIGMWMAVLLGKPLFVRYCGNWFKQRTLAERFWKWSMEMLAGGKNVMLATGGAVEAPSTRNPNLKWVFSTSLRRAQMFDAAPRRFASDGKLRLIIACRQEGRKGTEIVIESLPLILETFPEAVLDVVGDGAALDGLKQQAAELKLGDKVVFHGKIEQMQVVALMKQSHLFCYPTESEGFPKVVLEALACGLPVITTKVSVLPLLIGAGGGILLEKADASLLANAVERICSDENSYNEFSAKAIATARQYTLEEWRDCIGEILRESWRVSSLSKTC